MTQLSLDTHKLRKAFVIYLAMTKIDLSLLAPSLIEYDLVDFKNRLLPVMHKRALPRNLSKLKLWAENMVMVLQEALLKILPLNKNEIKFIESIRIAGKVQPEFITDDINLSNKIKSHPAILWAIKNSKK